jgi:hypothetical protein
MDVLLTPEVLSLLDITECEIIHNNEKTQYALLAFSRTHISFISSENSHIFSSPIFAEIRTREQSFRIPVTFDTSVKTSSKHVILSFLYSPENIASPLNEKWQSLLTINHFQQMRKDVRLSMNKKTLSALNMQSSEIQIWTHNSKKTCVLHNLSFSGARFFSTDDIALDSDDKLILKFSFSTPSEIATLRATVLRKQNIEIGGIPCLDIATRFLDPVDLVFLSRLTAYFQQNPESFI